MHINVLYSSKNSSFIPKPTDDALVNPRVEIFLSIDTSSCRIDTLWGNVLIKFTPFQVKPQYHSWVEVWLVIVSVPFPTTPGSSGLRQEKETHLLR